MQLARRQRRAAPITVQAWSNARERKLKKQRRGTTITLAGVICALVTGFLALSMSASAQQISAAQEPRRAAVVAKKPLPPAKKLHRLAVQVNVNEPAAMNLALNNASNVAQYYKELGEAVKIEIVAYGPGLHMLREDTSPVKDRIKSISESMPNIAFKACGNTQASMQKTEAKDIPLLSQATVVKSGVVQLMELQEQGWSYIRP
jgi:intracellular sulfur oxidation DsrE/DsrF family protein